MLRPIRTRTAALLGTLALHALIIVWALGVNAFTTRSIPEHAIQVLLLEKPTRVRAERPSALQMSQLKPVLLPLAAPHVNVPEQPPPPQALAVEQTSESTVSVVASAGALSTGSNGSGTASAGEGDDITVAHRVQPIYPDASVRAREQGYVVVGLLLDEHGHVRKAQVVQSSGFRRLDQSAVDALRQWSFVRGDGAPRNPIWTTFRYGFHLASSNAVDLSSITLALLPYDPALAEQLRAAAFPLVAAQAPKPYGAAALRRLVAAIQAAAPAVGRGFAGPLPPVQLVIKLGAVKSIQFLGLESHGLEVNAVDKVAVAPIRDSRDSQWELYKVIQDGGTSEWLIDVTRSGSISTAQAMTCTPEQDGMTRCP